MHIEEIQDAEHMCSKPRCPECNCYVSLEHYRQQGGTSEFGHCPYCVALIRPVARRELVVTDGEPHTFEAVG